MPGHWSADNDDANDILSVIHGDGKLVAYRLAMMTVLVFNKCLSFPEGAGLDRQVRHWRSPEVVVGH